MIARKLIASLAIAATLASSSAIAAPTLGLHGPEALGEAGAVQKVQWRRGGWGWRGPGPWLGLGIGAGIVAGAIIADRAYRPRVGYYYDTAAYNGPYYYPEDYRGDPRYICARYFRSFEWQTGLYTTYSGERRLCPYLR